MTVEQRTTIEPKDVLAVEIGCSKCGSRVRYPLLEIQPGQFRQRQHICPNCREEMLASRNTGPEINRVADLVEALQAIVRSESPSLIRLELASPAPAKP